MSQPLKSGQRWLSESEPELGLGILQSFNERTLTVFFRASGETRQYAREGAPLRRVRFHAGDTIEHRDGTVLRVELCVERDSLVFYRAGSREVAESDLSDQSSADEPADRLRNGQVDPSHVFDLRLTALQYQHRRRKSPVRGFASARIDLIPHQLYIAQEVAGRLTPRVLLADEVGLGKTIEACLIVHRLLQTGRAQRVLLVVPEPLVHQWFVELLRRFNLWFHIFDEERCDAIEATHPEVNPFLDDQLVLTALPFLAKNERRAQQAIAAGWDILVVDEAHHLAWAPDHPSPEYGAIEGLARSTPSLLLLTATPEQLGVASHFARLRLLDLDRYPDLDEFLRETDHYRTVARIADRLLRQEPLTAPDVGVLAGIFGRPQSSIEAQLSAITQGDAAARAKLVDDLIDQHGTGRVMFRNTRATITGFPNRLANLVPLPAPNRQDDSLVTSQFSAGSPPPGARRTDPALDAFAAEFEADMDTVAAASFNPKLNADPRILWLASLLRELNQEKILLVAHTRAKVEAIDEALRAQIQVKAALFHEGLTLVQRDRNAAWFAEEDGARILLASEIGSEGRNFQFAHHLVLFDLPLDPEVLEQRIGRLDRIGQTSEIRVHVPYIVGSPQEVLARWYGEGLNAFAKNLRGGHQLLEHFGGRVRDLAQDFHETQETARAALASLIRDTQIVAQEIALQMEQGRDRLLELNSFRPAQANEIIRGIRQADGDRSLDTFMLAVFEHFSIHVEELSKRTYYLGSAGVFADSFPGLPAEGLSFTLDRSRALGREDMQFLTWDHPLVTGAFDLIVGAPTGNSSFAVWPDQKATGLYLEAVYLLECLAPPALHVDRFLPPTPLRVIVDHRGNDANAVGSNPAWARQLKTAPPYPVLSQVEFRDELLPVLLQGALALARSQVGPLIAHARYEMNAQLSREVARLKELQAVNRNVRPAEIEQLSAQQRTLDRELTSARLRLDAVRVIQRGPPK